MKSKIIFIIFLFTIISTKIIIDEPELIPICIKKLKLYETDDSDNGSIEKSLMDAEKLRLQLINNYVKYLGHTYHSLTLKKLALIIEQLRYQLYVKEFKKQVVFYSDSIDREKESRRGR